MKKIYLLLAAVWLHGLSQVNAQGWAKAVNAGGGTNVYQNFTFDNNNHPVVMGGAEDYSGGTPNGFVFMKLDKETGMRSMLKKYNGNSNSESYKVHTDAQGNIYYFGTFTDYIAFGNDTLFTYNRVNWNYANFFIAKFDSEGNHVWSKKFGRKFGTEMGQVLDANFTQNGFHAMISYPSDSVFYDDDFIEKLPYISTNTHNFCLFKVNLSDGSLHTFKKVGGYYSSYAKMFVVNENGSYDFGTMEIAGFKKFVVYNFTDATAPVVKCSTNIVDQSNGTGHDIEQAVWFNGHYYLLGVNNSGGGWSTYDGDTVKTIFSPYNLRSGVLMKFDADFKLKAHARFQWRDRYPALWQSGGRLVVATRFSHTMYIENDSIACSNNQQAWEVMGFNEDLTLADTMQLNTANSSGGSFKVVCAGYDGAGNLYGQVVHNKDIHFYGTVVNAALRSWDHLTVLVRKGNNLGSGVSEAGRPVQVGVYPNPASNVLTIDARVNEVLILNVSGQEMLRSGSAVIDVSSLPAGVYFIRAGNGTDHYYSRFVKY